jgi:hypothetical protein
LWTELYGIYSAKTNKNQHNWPKNTRLTPIHYNSGT